jgi:hypothetical protein
MRATSNMIAAILRWITFAVVAITAVGLLYSVPFVIAVLSITITHLIHGVVPIRLGSDIIKAIVILGYFPCVILVGFNAVVPDNPINRKIWVSLIFFYFLSCLVCLFPMNVNQDHVEDLRNLSLFFLFLILLMASNLRLARRP